MKGFVGGYYKFCVWAMRLAYLNLLWMVFSVAGLILFGFMPATVGMFAVVRKWNLKEDDIPIFKTFWKTFRKEFVKANVTGYILFAIGYILSIELHVLQEQESIVYLIASFGIVALLLIYFIVVLYFFPIFVHFNLKTYHYFKWPFVIGVIHPILTIFLAILVLAVIYFTYMLIPALLIFFGGSMTAYILMWGVSKTFPKYEQKKA
jgi:uncharacterized membrane protein YesL